MTPLIPVIGELINLLERFDMSSDELRPALTLSFPNRRAREIFKVHLRRNMVGLDIVAGNHQQLAGNRFDMFGITIDLTTQERKEDGPQPRGPSSPATQRNNHGEVA